MAFLSTLRRVAATAAAAVVLVPAAQAQTTGTGCTTGLFVTCATWTLTGAGTSTNPFVLFVQNDGPPTQRFAEIGLVGIARANVVAGTEIPGGYDLNPSAFNGQLWKDGTLQPNADLRPRTDWGANGPSVISAGQSAIFTFTTTGLSAAPNITDVYVHAISGPAGQSQWVVLQSTVVPEPSTYALMATGLAGLAFAARRRRA